MIFKIEEAVIPDSTDVSLVIFDGLTGDSIGFVFYWFEEAENFEMLESAVQGYSQEVQYPLTIGILSP